MRNRRIAKNSIAALVYQVSVIVCGFILPRMILGTYGSAVNGLVTSITQFLSVISFLELGVGAVVRSALYKPLVEKDNEQISCIVASADKFFRRLAYILLAYVVVLVLVYPKMVQNSFSLLYSGVLIVCISISKFAQYYYGIVDKLLLTADQKGYVQYNIQTIAVIGNTIVCIVLIGFGASIHVVELTTSLVYLFRPFFFRRYVNRHYSIDRKIVYEGEPIKQKWNGVAQHVAAIVLDGTDSIVLTLFSTLANVSIYSIYQMVLLGVKQLFMSITASLQAMLGELWARQDSEELEKSFGWLEWLLHTGAVFVFGCTGVLMIPFVRVYTMGISDVEYIQPVFSVLITLANAGHCLRLPYHTAILSAGHYKQTQKNYIVVAVLNIVISVLTVRVFGLIGVAIGTLVAMIYQTVWMAVYNSKNLIKWPLKRVVKQFLVDLLTIIIAVPLSNGFKLVEESYFYWFILAVEVSLMWLLVVAVVNMIFYKDKVQRLMHKLVRR